MDWTRVPQLIEWAKTNRRLSVVVVVFLIFLYMGYEFIGGYASALGISFVTEYSKFKKSVASYTVVDNLLLEYLKQFSASRVGVARFHNSVRDIGNNSLFFVSYVSILTAPGITTDLEDIKNIPANTFGPVILKLLDNHPVFIATKDLPDGALRELLNKRGDVDTLYVPINDLNNRLIGFISISWVYEGQVPDVASRVSMLATLGAAADRIGAYFSAGE